MQDDPANKMFFQSNVSGRVQLPHAIVLSDRSIDRARFTSIEYIAQLGSPSISVAVLAPLQSSGTVLKLSDTVLFPPVEWHSRIKWYYVHMPKLAYFGNRNHGTF